MSDQNKISFELHLASEQAAAALASFQQKFDQAFGKMQEGSKNAGAGMAFIEAGARSLLGPLLALGTGAGAVMAVKESIQKVAETDSSMRRLRAELEMLSGDAKPLMVDFQNMASANREFAVSTRQSADAAREFIERGLTPMQAFQAAGFAAKLARAENMSYEESVQSLGMTIQTGFMRPSSALSAALGSIRVQLRDAADAGARFNIISKSADEHITQLADAQMGGAQGSFQKLGVAWNQFSKEAGEMGVAVSKPWSEVLAGILNTIRSGKDVVVGWVSDSTESKIQSLRSQMEWVQELANAQRQVNAANPGLTAGEIHLLSLEGKIAEYKSEIQRLEASIGAGGSDAANATAAAAQRQKRVAETAAELRTRSAQEIAAQAETIGAVAKLNASDRESRFELDQARLARSLQGELALVKSHNAQILADDKQTLDQQTQARNEAIGKYVSRLKELTGETDASRLRNLIENVSNGTANPTLAAGQYAVDPTKISEFVQSIQAASKLLQQNGQQLQGYTDEVRKMTLQTTQDQIRAINDFQHTARGAFETGNENASNLAGAGLVSLGEEASLRASAAKNYADVLRNQVLPALADVRGQASALGDAGAVEQLDDEIRRIATDLQKLDTDVSQGEFAGRLESGLRQAARAGADLATNLTSALDSAVNRLSSGFTKVIMGAQSLSAAMADVGRAVIEELIQMTIKAAIFASIFAVLSPGGSFGMGFMKALGFKSGGIVRAASGFVSGPGGSTDDRIPALLSNGEAVLPASVVSQNPGFIQSLISGAVNLNGMASQIPSAIAAPIAGSAAYAQSGGFSGSVHVSPAPVQVAVLNSPQHIRSFLESADGRKVLYDTVRAQMLELGLKS